MTTTFIATGTRIVWRLAEAHGLDAATIFRESGLDPANLEEPRGRCLFDRVCRAWARVAALSGNPHLGLGAAKHYRLTDLHALGIAFHSSSTLLSALHRLDRYESIMNSRLNSSPGRTGADDVSQPVAPPLALVLVPPVPPPSGPPWNSHHFPSMP